MFVETWDTIYKGYMREILTDLNKLGQPITKYRLIGHVYVITWKTTMI